MTAKGKQAESVLWILQQRELVSLAYRRAAATSSAEQRVRWQELARRLERELEDHIEARTTSGDARSS